MVAEIQEYKDKIGKNTAELGGRDEVIETFHWRLNEGAAPQPIKIRSNALKQSDLEQLARDIADATSRKEQLAQLIEHRGKLEAARFIETLDEDEWDKESETQRKLRLLNEKISELEAQPSRNEIAARFFMRVIAEWPFTINDEPVPLTVEGVSRLDPFFLVCLREDILDFLSPEKRKKRR